MSDAPAPAPAPAPADFPPPPADFYAYPPPPPPPPDFYSNCSDAGALGLNSCAKPVSGTDIVTSLVVNACIGLLCFTGFVLWRASIPIYSARRRLPGVRARPPPMPLAGLCRLWSWLAPVAGVSDAALLRSSGLDAFLAVRVSAFGVALFAPLALAGALVLIPVNYTASNAYAAGGAAFNDTLSKTFLRITISNIPNGSGLLWVHFFALHAFVGWACFLLVRFYTEHIGIRQTLLAAGLDADGAALWRGADDGPEARGDGEGGDGYAAAAAAAAAAGKGAAADGDGDGDAVLWPVRRPDDEPPDASRPRRAGAYAVLVVDEPAGVFRVRTGSTLLGVPLNLGLARKRSLSEAQEATAADANRWWVAEEEEPDGVVDGAGGGVGAAAVVEAVKAVEAGGGPGAAPPAVLSHAISTQSLDRPQSAAAAAMAAAAPAPPPPRPASAPAAAPSSLSRLALTARPPSATTAKLLPSSHAEGGVARLAASVRAAFSRGDHSAERTHREVAIRMRVVGETFSRLFGADFDRLQPIHETRGADAALGRLARVQAAADRAAAALVRAPTPAKRDAAAARVAALAAREADAQVAARAARAAALAAPPAPSFLALFRSARAAALAASLDVNPLHWRAFSLEPGVDPEAVNWPALQRAWWTRAVRSAAVLPFIVLVMLLPYSLITGAFSQITALVCGGQPGDKGSASGDWFCSDDFWVRLFRALITGLLPSILTAVYQAVFLPVAFMACAQAESRHFSLAKLDRRVFSLFFYWCAGRAVELQIAALPPALSFVPPAPRPAGRSSTSSSARSSAAPRSRASAPRSTTRARSSSSSAPPSPRPPTSS
jgi:hypothetical protein